MRCDRFTPSFIFRLIFASAAYAFATLVFTLSRCRACFAAPPFDVTPACMSPSTSERYHNQGMGTQLKAECRDSLIAERRRIRDQSPPSPIE